MTTYLSDVSNSSPDKPSHNSKTKKSKKWVGKLLKKLKFNRQENGEKIEQKTENNSKNIVFKADTSRLITSIEDVPKRSSVLILPTILENQELQKALDDNTTASQGTSKNKSSNNQKGKKIVDEYDKEINSLFNDIFEDRSKGNVRKTVSEGSSSSAALPPDK